MHLFVHYFSKGISGEGAGMKKEFTFPTIFTESQT